MITSWLLLTFTLTVPVALWAGFFVEVFRYPYENYLISRVLYFVGSLVMGTLSLLVFESVSACEPMGAAQLVLAGIGTIFVCMVFQCIWYAFGRSDLEDFSDDFWI